ncbi:MAG: hypothetical protein Q7J71_01020, partial [Polaromonas sp.]|nr:hypothetical protein [Polaromonas sp.]
MDGTAIYAPQRLLKLSSQPRSAAAVAPPFMIKSIVSPWWTVAGSYRIDSDHAAASPSPRTPAEAGKRPLAVPGRLSPPGPGDSPQYGLFFGPPTIGGENSQTSHRPSSKEIPDVPNIATVLKAEISRVARKDARAETQPLKKASSQYRSDIAALKRRVLALEKQLSRVL